MNDGCDNNYADIDGGDSCSGYGEGSDGGDIECSEGL